ncbi:MAG: hypothetical protein WCS31_05725 [Verrucomicrobiae bacterium]
MITSLSADAVKLRQRKMLSGSSAGGEEVLTTLSEKLDELFGAGYERDDIYGLVIPLLMQGKVRIDLDGRSERLEMVDAEQRFPRSNAVEVFDNYFAARPEFR